MMLHYIRTRIQLGRRSTGSRRSRAQVRRRIAGFTLVELLVAMAILGIGILSVGKMFIFSQQHAGYGREETMAVTLAQEIREKILSDNYDDLITIYDGVDTAVPGSITTPCTIWAGHVSAGLGASGRGLVQVLDHNQDPEIVDGMVTVVITMSWQETGRTQDAVMRFSVSKMGI
ncbi:MAG: prepilin-type N-terminal cleavage/methylation domain-containing protein [bacterium]|nr:prepilin-type N-terminal cleavage/methylation domain-containing protein [bacterium]